MFNPGQSSAQNRTATVGGVSTSGSMFNFTPQQKAEDKNLSSEEARSLFVGKDSATRESIYQKLKSEGYTFNEEQEPQTQSKGGFVQGVKNVSQGINDLGAGISGAGTKAAGGVLSIVGDFLSAPFSEDVSVGGIFSGKNKGGVGGFFRDETERQLQANAKAFGANRDSGLYKGSQLGAGIGLSVATPGGVLGLAGKGAGLATKVGLGATQGAIETGKALALTEGRLGTGRELALGATIGGAIPAIAPVVKGIGSYGASLLGKTTGAGGDAIKNAFKYAGNPNFVKALRGEITEQSVLDNAQGALQAIRQNRNAVYGKGYDQFLQKSKELGTQNIDDIADSFLSKVKQQGIKVSGDTLDFTKSKIANTGDQKLLTETLEDLRNFRNATPEELDILKQRVYDRFVVEKPIGTTTASEGIAKLVSGEIKNKLVNMIPEYKALSKSYEEATQAISEISKTLSLGKPNSAMTAMTRLGQTMKDNLSYRGEALKILEDLSGVNLTAQLAGAALNPAIGKGLSGVMQGGLSIAGLSNPLFWAAIPAGSPRLIGELANGLGISAKVLKGALEKIPGANVANSFVASRSSDPLKDLSFLRKLRTDGEAMGAPKELLRIIKGTKTAKEVKQAVEKAGMTEKLQSIYRK